MKLLPELDQRCLHNHISEYIAKHELRYQDSSRALSSHRMHFDHHLWGYPDSDMQVYKLRQFPCNKFWNASCVLVFFKIKLLTYSIIATW